MLTGRVLPIVTTMLVLSMMLPLANPVHADASTYIWRFVTASSDGTVQLNDTANTGVSVVIHATPLSTAIVSFQVLNAPPFGTPPLSNTTAVRYYVVDVQDGNTHGVPSRLCVTNGIVSGPTRMYRVEGLNWNASRNYWTELNSTVSGHTICASMDESQLSPAGIGIGTAQVSPPPAEWSFTETLELALIFGAVILGIAYFWRRIDRSRYKSKPFTVAR